jgi:hypothetical protein
MVGRQLPVGDFPDRRDVERAWVLPALDIVDDAALSLGQVPASF